MLGIGIFYEYLEVLRNCLRDLFQKYLSSLTYIFSQNIHSLYPIPENGNIK